MPKTISNRDDGLKSPGKPGLFVFPFCSPRVCLCCPQARASMNFNPDDLALSIFKREHVAVIGTKEELDAAAVHYGWTYLFREPVDQNVLLIAAVNFNSNQIVVYVDTHCDHEAVRETIINFLINIVSL